MTALLRYRTRALAADYAGAVAGLLFTLGPLAFVQPATSVAWVLAAAAALFLVYFGQTVRSQMTQIELDATGIRAKGPLGTALRWEDLCSLRLKYYSTRRDPEGRNMQGGWMQLELRDAKRVIRIDSRLDGFVPLVRQCAAQASRLGLPFDAGTLLNLEALGA